MMYLHFPGGVGETAVPKSGLETLARAKWLADGCGLPSALLSTLWHPLVGYRGASPAYIAWEDFWLVCVPPRRVHLRCETFPLPISTAMRHLQAVAGSPALSGSVR